MSVKKVPGTVIASVRTKVVVSVTEMARMVNLSRGRFYELVKAGIMPGPIKCSRTCRPLFTRELQQQALAVRETNVGVDGQYVCFYAQRQPRAVPLPRQTAQEPKPTPNAEPLADVLQGLRELGMDGVPTSAVASAVAECFPGGTSGVDDGVVLRSVWSHLRGRKLAAS